MAGNTKIDSVGAGVDNSAIIVDSSKAGFSSSYVKHTPLKEASASTPQTAQNISASNLSAPKLGDIVRDTKRTKVTDKDSVDAAKAFKLLLKSSLRSFEAKDFVPGTMLFYRYDAKLKELTYDKTPLMFVLHKSRGYVLGLNLHWCPIPLRLILIKYVIQMNKNNIKNNMPLHISYRILKPILYKLGLISVIRLYIFKRISRRGLVVQPDFWMSAAKLKSESFSGGYSAEYLYKMSLQKAKEWKRTRGHSDKVK